MSTKTSMFSVLDDNPFVDSFLDYLTSPEGIFREQVRDLTWEMLIDVRVDASKRRLLWGSEGESLDIEQSARRIYETVIPGQGVEIAMIEEEICGWLEMGYVPEDYTEKQMDVFEQKVANWVDEFRKSKSIRST